MRNCFLFVALTYAVLSPASELEIGQSADFGASYESNFGQLILQSKAREPINRSLDLNHETVVFHFSGEYIDHDLVNFYEYLINFDSDLLKPIEPNLDFFNEKCSYSDTYPKPSISEFRNTKEAVIGEIEIFVSRGTAIVDYEFYEPIRYGYSLNSYKNFKGNEDLTKEDLFKLTESQIVDFLFEEYAKFSRIDEIKDYRIQALLVRASLMFGTTKVVSWAQETLHIKPDGIIGEITLEAINMASPEVFLNNFEKTRISNLECGSLRNVASILGYLKFGVSDLWLSKLNKKYGYPTLPGLRPSVLEWTRLVRDKKIADDFAKSCDDLRLDYNNECVDKVDQNTFFVYYHILSFKINVPKSKLEKFLTGYESIVKDEFSYSNGWATYFVNKKAKFYNQVNNNTPSCLFSDDEINQDQNKGEQRITNVDSEFERVRTALLLSEGIGRRAPGRYPEVIFLDKGLEMPDGGLLDYHPDWYDQSMDKEIMDQIDKLICDMPDTKESHYIFGKGMLVAKQNGFGSVGLLPNISADKIKLRQIIDTDELFKKLANLVTNTRKVSGVRKIVNIGALWEWKDLGASDGNVDDAIEAIRGTIKQLSSKVLVIVASGHAEQKGESGIDLSKGCYYVPQCFGDLSNVITVATIKLIDKSLEEENIRFVRWHSSNKGGAIQIGAPGLEVISTDAAIDDAGEVRYGYSKQDGSSWSTVFVTAMAAEIWARNVSLTAYQVKERLIATVDAVHNKDDTSSIYGGGNAEIAAGVVNPLNAFIPKDDALILMGGESNFLPVEVRMTNMATRNGGKFVLFQNEDSMQDDTNYSCHFKDVIRIRKTGRNRYQIVCKTEPYENEYFKIVDGVLFTSKDRWKEKGMAPMECTAKRFSCIEYKRAGSADDFKPVHLWKIKDLLVPDGIDEN